MPLVNLLKKFNKKPKKLQAKKYEKINSIKIIENKKSNKETNHLANIILHPEKIEKKFFSITYTLFFRQMQHYFSGENGEKYLARFHALFFTLINISKATLEKPPFE